MSSSEAQKSPVHATSEDANTEPTNATGAGAAPIGKTRPDPDNDVTAEAKIGGGPGAGDASSGGGAGAGIPGGGTDMRTGGAFSGGDVEQDRKKLFPEARTHRNDPPGNSPPGTESRDDDARVGTDRDESSYGGPLNLDDADNV
jgi:hypothetical protein